MDAALQTVPEAHNPKAQRCVSRGVRNTIQQNSLSNTAIMNSVYFKGPI